MSTCPSLCGLTVAWRSLLTCSKNQASFAQSPPNPCSLIMSDMRGTVKAPSTSPEIQDQTAPCLGQHWGPIGQFDDVLYCFQGSLDSLGFEIAVVAIIGASLSTLMGYLRSCLLLLLSRPEVSVRSRSCLFASVACSDLLPRSCSPEQEVLDSPRLRLHRQRMASQQAQPAAACGLPPSPDAKLPTGETPPPRSG
jgi:hypothetical protein